MSGENDLIVGLLTVDLYLPGCTSLKEKRSVLRSLKERLGHKFNISIAEVAFMDKWQRCRLGIAQVGNDQQFLKKSLDKIFVIIDLNPATEVTEHLMEFL